MNKMKKSLKWTPAVPVRRPDNLISSRAKAHGDFGFKPSYVDEARENMNFIMSNEYMKKWFSERDYYQRELFIKMQTQMEEKHIRRRFVQRMLTREKKEKVMPIIQLRRFQNIGPKSDTRRDSNAEKKEDTKDDSSQAASKEKKQEKKASARSQAKKEAEYPVYQRYKPDCNVPPTLRKKNQPRNIPIIDHTEEKNGLDVEGSDQSNTKKVNVVIAKQCQCHCRCYKNGLEA